MNACVESIDVAYACRGLRRNGYAFGASRIRRRVNPYHHHHHHYHRGMKVLFARCVIQSNIAHIPRV